VQSFFNSTLLAWDDKIVTRNFHVMVDMGDGWKKVQEYPIIYNVFEHL
jgi:hypothetical protein